MASEFIQMVDYDAIVRLSDTCVRSTRISIQPDDEIVVRIFALRVCVYGFMYFGYVLWMFF